MRGGGAGRARAWLPSAHGGRRVVCDRILPDQPHVAREVLGRHVLSALELLANRPKVLRLFDHLQVVDLPQVFMVNPLSPDAMVPTDLWSPAIYGPKIQRVVHSTRTRDQLRNKQRMNTKSGAVNPPMATTTSGVGELL